MTAAEHRAMDLTAELVNVLVQEVIGDGPGRTGDVNEVVHHVHSLQRLIMSQAAGRAYPHRYRLLGGRAPS